MEQSPRAGSSEPPRRFQNSFLVQAWLVLILALIFGTALAAVQTHLSDVIAANKLNETLAKVPGLVGGAAGTKSNLSVSAPVGIDRGTVSVKKGGLSTVYQIFKVTRGKQIVGWVARAGGQGYADKIELLIGFDADMETITGLFVLEQKETPGLGNKIILPSWRNQFANQPTAAPLVIALGGDRPPNAIDAVTGATISSRSVTAIVNRTVSDIRGNLTPASFRASERP